jgi:hypothetical protein
VNYFLIPKEMGSHHDVIEQFTETTVNILKSEEFFYMMTIIKTAGITMEVLQAMFSEMPMQSCGNS